MPQNDTEINATLSLGSLLDALDLLPVGNGIEKEDKEDKDKKDKGPGDKKDDDKKSDDDKKDDKKKDEKKKDEKKDDLIDGIPDWFVAPMLAELTAHEVGHTLGLRHNFKASTVVDPTYRPGGSGVRASPSRPVSTWSSVVAWRLKLKPRSVSSA